LSHFKPPFNGLRGTSTKLRESSTKFNEFSTKYCEYYIEINEYSTKSNEIATNFSEYFMELHGDSTKLRDRFTKLRDLFTELREAPTEFRETTAEDYISSWEAKEGDSGSNPRGIQGRARASLSRILLIGNIRQIADAEITGSGWRIDRKTLSGAIHFRSISHGCGGGKADTAAPVVRSSIGSDDITAAANLDPEADEVVGAMVVFNLIVAVGKYTSARGAAVAGTLVVANNAKIHR